jgi:peptidoglycan hydrolase-like protein with peptidoglycan-binding domain
MRMTRIVGVLALGLSTAACGSGEDQRAGMSALDKADRGPAEVNWPSRSSEQLVRRAQSELQREGLYEGTVDGIAGTRTKQAITVFQQREGLKQNASVDRMTLARLTLNALRMDGALNAEAASAATPEGSGSSNPPADGRSSGGSSR